VRGRLHPPPEEDLGGGDICSLEEQPSTEDNMPLVAHAAVDTVREAEFEHYNPKRSLGAVAIALTVAVFGALSPLIVDHGLWNRPHVKSARAHAATEAAAEADGAIVRPEGRLWIRETFGEDARRRPDPLTVWHEVTRLYQRKKAATFSISQLLFNKAVLTQSALLRPLPNTWIMAGTTSRGLCSSRISANETPLAAKSACSMSKND
jgi:hypothetical protein